MREAHWLESYPFPSWARYLEAAIPVSLAIGVGIQHDAIVPPEWPFLVAILAGAPIVLCLVFTKHVARYRRVGGLVTLGAVSLLILDPVPGDVAPFFLVHLVGSAALVAPRWESLATLAGAIGVMVGVELSGHYDGAFVWLLGFVVAWGAGIGVRAQAKLTAELSAAQSTLAEQAVIEERQRIAREIHDVVAHTLSVTMLYVTGARLALQRDPAEAEEALLAAEKLGRESLAEIRRTVGLLAPDASGTEAPMPTAADVPELVEDFRAAGLDVDLTLVGDAEALPPATGLALYRVAQESLTNVVKHAPGARASVVLELGVGGDVRLRVRNPVPPGATPSANGGLGVLGMRQRVELLGGTFDASIDRGQWVVAADVPQSGAVA